MGITAHLKNSIAENLLRRMPGLYGRLRGELTRTETMTPPEREALRTRLTGRTLALARATAYGQAIPEGAPYADWSILEKDVLRAAPDACTRRGFLPPHAAATGGTTGVPILLQRSMQSVVFEQAVLDHLVERHAGLSWKTARIAVLRGDTFKSPDDMAPPHWRLRQGGRHLVCSSIHLNAATVDDFITAIDGFSPDILWVYPSALEAFVRLGGERLARRPITGLKLVFSSSEVLDRDTCRRTSALLGVPVLDFYGQSERVCASFSIDGERHYFMPAYGRVELLHAHDDGGDSLYEIVGTSYRNPAQPLIRFRTGDLARLPKGLSDSEIDAVTLGLRPFLGIDGRRSEYLVSPEGARIIGLNHIPRGVPDIAQMQIVQTAPGRVEIRVVPLKSFGATSAGIILANARQKIPQSMQLEIRTVDRLTHTASGKTPLALRHFD